jgi:DNA repair exonuclease SbcCD ATPase subunit
MKFTGIEIENFLAITEGKVSLSDRGLVLIQGENDDDPSASSNGAGKSSMADAVSWALYGSTARGISGDSVVNNKVGKNCRVVLTVDDDGKKFLITRHRKHKTGKNTLTLLQVLEDDSHKNMTEGTDKLTQDKVNKLIGCSYEVFRSAVYAGQEQMPDLPAMTDKHLKILIEEAAGIKFLEEAYDEARNEATAATGRHSSAVTQHKNAVERRFAEVERIADLTDRQTTWVHNQKVKIKEKKDLLGQYVMQYGEHKAKYEAADVPALEAKRKEILTKITTTSETERATERDLLRLQNKYFSLLDAETKSLKYAKDALAHAQTHLESVDAEVGKPCEGCGRDLTKETVSSRRKIFEEKVETAKNLIVDAEKNLEDAKLLYNDASRQLEEFRAKMIDFSKEEADIEALNGMISKAEAIKSEMAKAASSAKGCKSEIEALEKEENPFTALIERTHLLVKNIELEIEEAKKNVEVREREKEIANLTASVFSPSGVRAEILDEVTPFLNDQTAAYLGALSDGNITATWSTISYTAKGDARERFVIEVKNELGADNFMGLSGGEKRKVRIACTLALQDLVARRAIKPIELFIGDEIDDALDDAGLERLMGVLEEKAKERGSVFVISHRSLRDWISNVLLVQKTKDGSIIKEVAA